jgi:hypothetical protein
VDLTYSSGSTSYWDSAASSHSASQLKHEYFTTTGHKEDQLDDLRNIGESSCNYGDGTDQRVQSLMFMMMMKFRRSPTSFGIQH